MTRRRWMADQVEGDRAAIVGEHAAHLVRVLRARVGQEFDISTGGRVRRGTVVEVEPERVVFNLGEELDAATLPAITLLLAVFKFERMEWAIEKCTELGVAEIVPVISRRVDPHLAAAAAKRVERWRRIGLQASEQSRRAAPPEIGDPLKLRDALAGERDGMRIVLAESEKKLSLVRALQAWSGEPITIAAGPEGGWTDEECAAFAQSGWMATSLGPTILRAETAAIAALAVILGATSQ